MHATSVHVGTKLEVLFRLETVGNNIPRVCRKVHFTLRRAESAHNAALACLKTLVCESETTRDS